MEQTGSIAYPNVLVMDYLLRSKQMKPELRMKAEQYVNLGYQRLLTFQTPAGGFALWGASDEPKVFLTAWGLQILQDAKKVHDVDDKVLERAKSWLAARQNPDGSFPVSVGVHTEIWGRMEGELGMTSYVVWSLAEGGDRGAMVTRGMEWLKKHVGETKNPYLLALAGAAFASAEPKSEATRALLDRLDAARTEDAKERTIHWASTTPTMVYAAGNAADVETTALAAYALHKGGVDPNNVNKALMFLVKAKDASGAWGSTQGTILSLKALLAASDPGSASGDSADVTVILNGKPVTTVAIRPENSDVMQVVDLRSGMKTGRNTVTIASKGAANTMYQTVARWWLPGKEAPKPAGEPLSLDVSYDRTHLAAEDLVTATAKVTLHEQKPAFMVILDLGIPPGFEPDRSAFEAMKEKGTIAKYSMTGRQITVYLDRLAPEAPLALSYALKARLPIKAKAPTSTAYEYYTPSRRGEASPVELVVVPKG